MGGYAAAFIVAAAATALLCWPAVRLSHRWHMLKEPDGKRHLHPVATPVLGGSAMCLALLVALLVTSRIHQFHEIFATSEPLGVAIGALVITAVGTLDDRIAVSPPAKMAGQVLSGSALYLFGVTMYFFRLPVLDIVDLSPDLTPLITVVWVIGMANAVNFIDGVDGLAAGVVAIGAAAFFLYSRQLFDAGRIAGDNMGPLLAVIACGVCVGFLPWNWTQAKIFMGDAGAMLLGLLMACSTMVVGGRASEPSSGQTYFFFAPLIIPFLILGVPIADTVLSIVRRTARGGGVSIADRQHIHHRLLELGHGPRRTVVILCSLTAILSALVLGPTYAKNNWVLLPLGVMLGVTIGFALWPRDRIRRVETRDLPGPRSVS